MMIFQFDNRTTVAKSAKKETEFVVELVDVVVAILAVVVVVVAGVFSIEVVAFDVSVLLPPPIVVVVVVCGPPPSDVAAVEVAVAVVCDADGVVVGDGVCVVVGDGALHARYVSHESFGASHFKSQQAVFGEFAVSQNPSTTTQPRLFRICSAA